MLKMWESMQMLKNLGNYEPDLLAYSTGKEFSAVSHQI